jgi:hypothetical protein
VTTPIYRVLRQSWNNFTNQIGLELDSVKTYYGVSSKSDTILQQIKQLMLSQITAIVVECWFSPPTYKLRLDACSKYRGKQINQQQQVHVWGGVVLQLMETGCTAEVALSC